MSCYLVYLIDEQAQAALADSDVKKACAEQIQRMQADGVFFLGQDSAAETVSGFDGIFCPVEDLSHYYENLIELMDTHNFEEDDIVFCIEHDALTTSEAVVATVVEQMGVYEHFNINMVVSAITPAVAQDPQVVKAITNKRGYLMYMSRMAIPYHQDKDTSGYQFRCHGVMAFRASVLESLQSMDGMSDPLSIAEDCRHLNLLWNGHKVHAAVIDQ